MTRRYSLLLTALIWGITLIAGIYLGLTRFVGAKLDLSADERAWIGANNGKLRAGGDPGYPPVDFVDVNGEHAGMSEEMLRMIEAETGLKFRRVPMETFQAAVDAVRDQKIELTYAIAPTLERRKFMIFTKPYITIPTVLVTKHGDRSIGGIRDLHGKTLAITGSYASFEHFKQMKDAGFTLVPAASDEEALIQVSLGTVDAAVSDLPTISWLANKGRIGKVRVVGETDFVWEISFGLPKDQQVLHGIINKALASFPPADKKQIHDKWIGVEYKNVFYSERMWVAATLACGAAASIALMFLLWDRSLSRQVKSKTNELNSYKVHLEQLVQARTKELETANQQLSLLATTDPLTGAYNRRVLLESSERQHLLSLRTGRPYCLIAFDLDHFKLINDRFGHSVGDEVLKAVVVAIQRHLRRTDILARFGGEEFYILLPETESAPALFIAERCRHDILNIRLRHEDGNVRVSASFGVCQFKPDEPDLGDFLHRTDMALYQAKQNGRDQVVAGDPGPTPVPVVGSEQ